MSASKPHHTKAEHKTKKFGKGERSIPHPTHKAKKFYPAEDEAKPKKARKTIRPSTPRPTLTPGTVLILLAGRFRGKRVIHLRNLPQGVILVTGPFKINGVPLRRVNARYVIATRARVPLEGKLDEKVVEKIVGGKGKDGGDGGKGYFTKGKREQREKGEEAFFKQGGDGVAKKEVSGERAEDQKKVDKAVLEGVKGVPHLREYLASTFSLRKGDKPHAMVF